MTPSLNVTELMALRRSDAARTQEFVRYVLVFFGFVFVLIFQRMMSFYLEYKVLANWSAWMYWSGVSIFFGVHAYCLARILILYTRYELHSWSDYIVYFRQTLGSTVGVLASHIYCILVPSLYLNSHKETVFGVGTREAMVDYWWFSVLDIGLLLALVGVSRVFKSFDAGKPLYRVKVKQARSLPSNTSGSEYEEEG